MTLGKLVEVFIGYGWWWVSELIEELENLGFVIGWGGRGRNG